MRMKMVRMIQQLRAIQQKQKQSSPSLVASLPVDSTPATAPKTFATAAFISAILLTILISGSVVHSAYVLSKDCTIISLRGQRITVVEGQEFSFTLSPYISGCDLPGCKIYQSDNFVCKNNPWCKTCSLFQGPFSENIIQLGIWLLSDINVTAPGASCKIGNTSVGDEFPASCLIRNNHASDMEQYILRVVVFDESRPGYLGSSVDLIQMIQLGAVVKIVAGQIDPLSSKLSWAESPSVYHPGDTIKLTVALKDSYGNTVGAKTGRSDLNYLWNVTIVDSQTNSSSYPDFDLSIDQNGYHNISFIADKAGSQSVYVSHDNKKVGGISLSFYVFVGMSSSDRSASDHEVDPQARWAERVVCWCTDCRGLVRRQLRHVLQHETDRGRCLDAPSDGFHGPRVASDADLIRSPNYSASSDEGEDMGSSSCSTRHGRILSRLRRHCDARGLLDTNSGSIGMETAKDFELPSAL